MSHAAPKACANCHHVACIKNRVCTYYECRKNPPIRYANDDDMGVWLTVKPGDFCSEFVGRKEELTTHVIM